MKSQKEEMLIDKALKNIEEEFNKELKLFRKNRNYYPPEEKLWNRFTVERWLKTAFYSGANYVVQLIDSNREELKP